MLNLLRSFPSKSIQRWQWKEFNPSKYVQKGFSSCSSSLGEGAANSDSDNYPLFPQKGMQFSHYAKCQRYARQRILHWLVEAGLQMASTTVWWQIQQNAWELTAMGTGWKYMKSCSEFLQQKEALFKQPSKNLLSGQGICLGRIRSEKKRGKKNLILE